MNRLNVLYRGPLKSCNYQCWYCPFAKRAESGDELETDRSALARFIAWVEGNSDIALGVLFTPWGEALVRPWYQDALVRLSHLPHVQRAAAQTNGRWPLEWIEQANRDRLALWMTYHPTEIARPAFVERCHVLRALGVRFSVGVVALRDHFEEIRRLRDELPTDTYLWLNAYKDGGAGYSPDEIRALEAIDPLFRVNTKRHASGGQGCDAGNTAIAIDGEGVIRRCHFIDEPIGNIADRDWRGALRPRACTNRTCGCHIGYVHLHRLGLGRVFGDGLLERIPTSYDRVGLMMVAPRLCSGACPRVAHSANTLARSANEVLRAPP